ncbi:MAG TPA: coniferyl aldehyde dehydrogenase [Steroidobacteraceae bacterium]|nr:coniferyl aldehyde dehydrogenase [Steroidobacteraceae bacterium]
MNAPAVRAIFDGQRLASRNQTAPTLSQRLQSLDKLRDLVRSHGAAITRAISEDYGVRAVAETELLEIVPTLNAIRHARRKLASWMKPQRRPVELTFQPARAWVRFEPLGVIGIISPWNYPLLLSLAPLVDAIAAGNRVMLKPADLTPNFSSLLRDLIAQRFDAHQVSVVTGDVETARIFSSLPFDHLLFTGSTAVGKQVMQAAAANLTPVTLELGGKSPAIVCADYPLDKAARSIAFGKFLNAGQTCIAPDYVLIPAAQCDAFAQLIMEQVKRSYPTVAANADYSGILLARQRERLTRALDEARLGGAAILSHGEPDCLAAGKFPPTVVIGAPHDGILLREEIFGPILPVVPYESLEDALSFVAARERPLALYCFTNDAQSRAKVLDRALSGGVTLNGTLLHIAQDALPFGGIGPSGTGAYHGRDGFLRLSHARAVYKVGFVNVFERLGPPWGRLATLVTKIFVKR